MARVPALAALALYQLVQIVASLPVEHPARHLSLSCHCLAENVDGSDAVLCPMCVAKHCPGVDADVHCTNPLYEDFSTTKKQECAGSVTELKDRNSAEKCRASCLDHAKDNGYSGDFCCQYKSDGDKCRVAEDGSTALSGNNEQEVDDQCSCGALQDMCPQ